MVCTSKEKQNFCIYRDDDGLYVSVYRKPTSNIHHYSAQSSKTKSGVVTGFFLRALRICSPEFLEDKIKHIIDSFVNHQDPKGFLLNLRKKAANTITRARNDRAAPSSFLVLPQCNISETTEDIANTSDINIGETAHKRSQQHQLCNNPEVKNVK